MRSLCGDRIAGLTARDGEPVEVATPCRIIPVCRPSYTRARRAYQALRWHHPRRAAPGPMCRSLSASSTPTTITAWTPGPSVRLGQSAAAGKATMVGLSAAQHRQRPRYRVPGRVPGGNGHLAGIHEALKIQLFPDGSIADVADGQRRELAAGYAGCPRNFWGFMPSIFDQMETYLGLPPRPAAGG